MFIVIEEEYLRKDTKESRIETLQNRIPVFL